MTISREIQNEAVNILKRGEVLPCGIKVGGADPVYFVSDMDDSTIIAHSTILHGEKKYKIGTKK